MRENLLIYGSYGYTGRLIAREAVARGWRPTLGGRSASVLRAQAEEAGLPYRCFGLDTADEVTKGLEGMGVVLNCAGPFARTARPMVDGCLKTGTHYLDITGEIEVFEGLAARAAAAQAAGVMLLPGAGFDVVPSDCLAAHLKRLLPTADRLMLAFMTNGGMSHGTATTVAESLPKGLWVRRNGALVRVPAGWKRRDIDFGKGPVRAITIAWGDVSTAWYSTGIPNIEVYMAAPLAMRAFSVASRFLGPVLGSGPVQRYLKRRIDAAPAGPTDEMRARGWSRLWGQASDAEGRTAEARLNTQEGYTLTVLASLLIAEKALDGIAPAGYQTPAKAYGPDLVTEIPGVTRS